MIVKKSLDQLHLQNKFTHQFLPPLLRRLLTSPWLWGCMSGWFTHEKQTGVPLQQQEKWMWVWTRWEEGRSGKKEAGTGSIRGGEKRLGRSGDGEAEQESESCHKTAIIRGLSATQ